MDTRQLAAFCAVVEKRSFSQAAARLGVTQPAVSLQIRALEKRLGQQLLDRSGRRVEPTEAGLRLYRSAQRMLALEEQLLEEVAGTQAGDLRGTLAIGASTGPAARSSRPSSPSSSAAIRTLGCALRLGHAHRGRSRRRPRARARHRRRGAPPSLGRSRAALPRPGRARVPARTSVRGRTVSLDELRAEPLIAMQEGAGVRQVIEDELRQAGTASAISTSG
jgi:DNA-binding transcriptional LysR family regulator